jgi:S-adenosylmethionine-diacylglycerol 3-amino-3-carboxypropyl transferase
MNQIKPTGNIADIRYAQCWEDADLLLQALDVQPGDICLSIISGGENTLSLLTRRPGRVIAVDFSAAQLACLEIKCAAFRQLDHEQMLELLGARPSEHRLELYNLLRNGLNPTTRDFWDQRKAAVAAGIGSAGRFEAYFSLFRRYILPLTHRPEEVEALFDSTTPHSRRRYYEEVWDNRRWRWLMRLFLSRPVMSRLGRDKTFFRFARGSLTGEAMSRVKHALTALDPAKNPYLQWIALGSYRTALPHALRAENFSVIRDQLDRLEMRQATLQATLEAAAADSIDRFNLSDVFEYLSEPDTEATCEQIARTGRSGGRAVYWNMQVPRACPERLRESLHPLDELAANLLPRNKAAFYSALHVEALQ